MLAGQPLIRATTFLPAPALTPAASGFAAVPMFMHTAGGTMSMVSGQGGLGSPSPASAHSLPAASVVFGGSTKVVPAADGSTFNAGGPNAHGGRTVKPFGSPSHRSDDGGNARASGGGGGSTRTRGTRVDMDDREFTQLTNTLRTYASRFLTSDQVRACCLSCYILRRGPNGGKPPSGHKTRDCFHLRQAAEQAVRKGLTKAK